MFSEIIGIWVVSVWNTLGRPKRLNFVELGPGDGSLIKILLKTFKIFPQFNNSLRIFLYEKSSKLTKLQKKNINDPKVRWIKNFKNINTGPVIFFGNEFFDAIPIKQFLRKEKKLLEKFYSLDKKNKIIEIYKNAKRSDIEHIEDFKTLKNLKFIEFPKLGLIELKKIKNKVSNLGGGILLIDYGYTKKINKSTLQSVFKHKKNDLFRNLGAADITSLVNFNLLKEYFLKNSLKVKNIVDQKFFLERMGIIKRADIISKNMGFNEQANLYLRLKRLLDHKFMGNLFKVLFAYKSKKNNFLGFN